MDHLIECWQLGLVLWLSTCCCRSIYCCCEHTQKSWMWQSGNELCPERVKATWLWLSVTFPPPVCNCLLVLLGATCCPGQFASFASQRASLILQSAQLARPWLQPCRYPPLRNPRSCRIPGCYFGRFSIAPFHRTLSCSSFQSMTCRPWQILLVCLQHPLMTYVPHGICVAHAWLAVVKAPDGIDVCLV